MFLSRNYRQVARAWSVRRFVQAQAATSVQPQGDSSPIQRKEASLSAPELFTFLKKRGHGKGKVALGDLQLLLEKCHTLEEAYMAADAINFYQHKLHDFNVQIASLFVQAVIRGGKPVIASRVFSIYTNRIGGWVSPKVYQNLVFNSPPEDLDFLTLALQVTTIKGLKPTRGTLDRLLTFAVKNKNIERYDSILAIVAATTTPEFLQAMKDHHKRPVAGEVGSDAEEGEVAEEASAAK